MGYAILEPMAALKKRPNPRKAGASSNGNGAAVCPRCGKPLGAGCKHCGYRLTPEQERKEILATALLVYADKGAPNTLRAIAKRVPFPTDHKRVGRILKPAIASGVLPQLETSTTRNGKQWNNKPRAKNKKDFIGVKALQGITAPKNWARMYELRTGDALGELRKIKNGSVNAFCTSPPYWWCRKYKGLPGQYGLEATIEKHVDRLQKVFAVAHKKATADGVAWLVLGDQRGGSNTPRTDKTKTKVLCRIPNKIIDALEGVGWYCMSEITWCKTNPCSQSVKSRPTDATEKIFMLAKSPGNHYFGYKALKEICKTTPSPTDCHSSARRKEKNNKLNGDTYPPRNWGDTRNTWDWWEIAINPVINVKHTAKMPIELARRLVLGSCPKGGLIVDMFGGAHTIGMLAVLLNRKYIGIEIAEVFNKRAEKQFRTNFEG